MYCKNCGAEIKGGDIFCGFCGSPISPEKVFSVEETVDKEISAEPIHKAKASDKESFYEAISERKTGKDAVSDKTGSINKTAVVFVEIMCGVIIIVAVMALIIIFSRMDSSKPLEHSPVAFEETCHRYRCRTF